MAEILETLGTGGQLGKVLYELLEQVATSVVLKANEKDKIASSSLTKGQVLPLCKSVPVSSRDGAQFDKGVASDENEKSQTNNTATVVDSSLGRPRYQWHDTETEAQERRRTVSKDLYSVYVGHLPTDITAGELEDLFSDTGEVVNTYVFPPSTGHSYTYGFVRFYTLEEAKDAVRAKHLKVIGSRQINVELSSSTRRNLSTNPDEEDGRPLLQREYPKVQRPSNSEENQVIERIKASLRRLSCNTVSSLGDYNPEEVFENIKTILKMLINYPMSLADPSADMCADKPRSDSSMTKHQTLTQNDFTQPQKKVSSEVANHHAAVPRYQTTSRLSSCSGESKETLKTNSNKTFCNGVIVDENHSVKSESLKSNVTKKVLEYLNLSSGEDNESFRPVKRSPKKIPDSRHASSTEDEILAKSTIPAKPSLKNCRKSPTYAHDRPHARSKWPQFGSSPVIADELARVVQTKSHYDFPAHYDKQIQDSSDKSRSSKTSHNMPESIATNVSLNYEASIQPITCATIASNTKLSGSNVRPSCCSDTELLQRSAQPLSTNDHTQLYNNNFGQMSCRTELTTEPVHGASPPSLSLNNRSKMTEQTCLSPNSGLGILGKDVQRRNDDKSQAYDVLSGSGFKHFQFQSSSYSENTSSQYSSLSCSSPPISKVEKEPEEMLLHLLSSQRKEDKECPLPSRKHAVPVKHPHNSLNENHFCSEERINVNREIDMPMACNIDDSRVDIPNQGKQHTFSALNRGISSTAYSSPCTKQTSLEQPVSCASINEGVQQDEKFVLAKGQIKREVSEQQNDWPKQVCETSSRATKLNERAASTNGYDFLPHSCRVLDMNEVDAQVRKDNAAYDRDFLPGRSCPLSSSKNGTEVINDFPLETRRDICISNGTVQSQENRSAPDESTSVNSHGLLSENNSDPLLDCLPTNVGDYTSFANKKSLKSPGRRVLAPSFSFSSRTKDDGGKILTKHMPSADCCISNSPDLKGQSKTTADIMVNDSATVDLSKSDVLKPVGGPAFESAKSIWDDISPSDDVEIIKLKVKLDESARKLEELQQTLDKFPKHRRQILAPNLFSDYARSSQLEREIGDAEILLQKKEEIGAVRSNEQELAYEKELLYSPNGHPFLSQFATEMKKNSLRTQNDITDLKCKILQLKIERYQLQEDAQT